jgi:GDPmannose 4,6-dehydratase
MYLILQQPEPDDYVIATGITTEVREFARMAFAEAGIALAFTGSGKDEQGVIDSIDAERFESQTHVRPTHLEKGQVVIEVDPYYYRPTEVDLLVGDPTKARTKLGWSPKHTLHQLVQEMVAADLLYFRKEKVLRDHGHDIIKNYEI